MRIMYIAAALAALQSAAYADTLPDGGVTAPEVVKALVDKGYRAEATTKPDGAPMILSNTSGIKFGVFFYDCSAAPRCNSIQFSAGFTAKNVSPEKIAEWNRRYRFGKAFLTDSDSNVLIQMDIDTQRGLTPEAIVSNVERWDMVVSQFVKFVRQ